MKNKLLILFLIFSFSGYFLYAQTAPDTLWTKHFGGIHEDSSTCIRENSDSSLIIIGTTDQTGNGMNDIWLIKTDENGNMLWDKTFGGNQNDFSIMGQQTADGGFIIAGTTESFGNGMRDFWLIKTDADGNEEWNQTYGTAENDRTQYVEQTSDGGYVVTGGTGNFENNNQDVWLIKTDENGNLEWQQTYGGNGNEKTYTVHQETDGNYILAGLTSSYGNGMYDAYLIKTDSLGNEIWSYVYGTDVLDYCYSIDITSDGDFILGGLTNATANGDVDVLAMKISDSGDEIWTKNIGLTGDDPAIFIEQTKDGGYVLAGYTNSFGNGHNDVYIVKLAPDATTDAEDIIDQPSGYHLWNYPNPFNPPSTIRFSSELFPQNERLEIKIFNLKGQTVKTFSNLHITQSHNQQIVWNGTDQSNRPVSSGMYYAVLKQNDITLASKKMMLMK